MIRILITGGAGFVGSNLALLFKEKYPAAAVMVADNLKRRGSELHLPALRRQGVSFFHADIRNREDLEALPGSFDVLIDAAADPSAQAAPDGCPDYLLQSNLIGTLNSLEFVRRRAGAIVFLSSSRVYSIGPLRSIGMTEGESRFELNSCQDGAGISQKGMAETFAVNGPRSLYGASKLASELIIQEYAFNYGLRAVINRCGVMAGAGQFGRIDQGVFTLWVANHLFRKPLKYTGFGGSGKQVRDLLHPADLFSLIEKQLSSTDACSGEVFNVGGGLEHSISLLELTTLCRELAGSSIDIGREPNTTSTDIPLYISDHTKATERFQWRPTYSVRDIARDIHCWLTNHQAQLVGAGVFGI